MAKRKAGAGTRAKPSVRARGKIKYYARCASTVHGDAGWTSHMYDTQRPAENAVRMHNTVNFPGHNAKLLTKHV